MNNNEMPWQGRVNAGVLASLGLGIWLLAGCTQLQAVEPEPTVTALNNDVHIRVYFKDNCPVAVSDSVAEADAKSGRKLKWQAYDIAYINTPEDAVPPPPKLTTVNYSVYFDPFKGKTDDSKQDGSVTSAPLDNDLPGNVVFKYTIIALNEQDKPLDSCVPLDPFFRIR